MTSFREKAILEAAKSVFMEKGYSGARMQKIADKANINKSMLHYYFRSKEQLFGDIIEDMTLNIVAKYSCIIDSEITVIEKFDKIIDEYTDLMVQNPYAPLFLLNEISQNNSKHINTMKAAISNSRSSNKFLKQILKEQKLGLIKSTPSNQVIFTVLSLLVFPFIANSFVKNILEIEDESYTQIILERKALIKTVLRQFLMT
ncbi:TetR/AcrR family transcriptional regulator [Winogradskyella sp.]|uniref:TetR/AcrR family transcriptional regulator n=1 Tax=Winogradskyella sp. TaxID=1883156 RepID=UPI0026284930|nr:TetR/AcrR family transcriptional regulator [Winogradskyella sp.]